MAQIDQDYRVNDEIKIREVRLIDQRGEQVGVVTVERARELAVGAGLDLVEVAPNSRPPVCRIMDYGKFRYELQKKHRGHKHHESQLHEVRVRPNIDKHDLSYKIDKAREFLMRGDKVQVDCRFRGREIAHPEIGRAVCQRVIDAVADIARVETPAKIEGKRMTVLLARKGTGGVATASGPGGAPAVSAAAAVPAAPGNVANALSAARLMPRPGEGEAPAKSAR